MSDRSLLAVLLLFAFSFARADETMLRTAAELDSFGEDTRRRYTPFTLTGTVESVSPVGSLTVFRDASAWVEFRNKSGANLTSGDIIRATGFCSCGTAAVSTLPPAHARQTGTTASTASTNDSRR